MHACEHTNRRRSSTVNVTIFSLSLCGRHSQYLCCCYCVCLHHRCMILGMPLITSPNWRLLLGFLFIPSLLYFALTIHFCRSFPSMFSEQRKDAWRKVLQKITPQRRPWRRLQLRPNISKMDMYAGLHYMTDHLSCSSLPHLLIAILSRSWKKSLPITILHHN